MTYLNYHIKRYIKGTSLKKEMIKG